MKILKITLRYFELDLLDMLGYGFDYDIDIDTNDLIDPNKSYLFVAEKVLENQITQPFMGKIFLILKTEKLDKVSRKHLKHITTEAISACLDGKDLASRQIFKKLDNDIWNWYRHSRY